MWRAFCTVTVLVALGCVGAASAGESMYQTKPTRQQRSFGADTSFVFMAPYITSVETTLSASIGKATASGSPGGSQSPGGQQSTNQTKAQAPSVSYADFVAAQNPSAVKIRYSVSCDLHTALQPKDPVNVTVTLMTPSNFVINASGMVVSVTPDQIVVSFSPPPSLTRAPVSTNGGVLNISKNGTPVACPIWTQQFVPISKADVVDATKGQYKFSVSCDLSPVLKADNPVTVIGMTPSSFDTTSAKVASVQKDSVNVVYSPVPAQNPSGSTNGGLVIIGNNTVCPDPNIPISKAELFVPGQIKYWVSCDLTTILHKGDQVIVNGISPASYNTTTTTTPTPGKNGETRAGLGNLHRTIGGVSA
jgi:hypothetical protein